MFSLISGRLICLVPLRPLLTIQSHDLFTGADGENGKKKDKDTQESERKLFPHPPKTLWGLELRFLQSLPEFSHLCFVATFG